MAAVRQTRENSSLKIDVVQAERDEQRCHRIGGPMRPAANLTAIINVVKSAANSSRAEPRVPARASARTAKRPNTAMVLPGSSPPKKRTQTERAVFAP
jgi:hypothetical protein